MRDRTLGLLVLGAIVLTYAPSLAGGWTWDDVGWASEPADLAGALFGKSDSPLWRPVATLPVHAIHALTPEPLAHRLSSLALHLVAVASVAAVARSMGARPVLAWFGAALFGLHAGSSEPVAWISAQTELVPAVLTLLGLAALARGREWTAGLLWALTPFGKEAWLLLPASGLVWCWGAGRFSARALGTAFAGCVAYLGLRQLAASNASFGSLDLDPFGSLGYITARGLTLLLVPAASDACPLYVAAPALGIVATIAVLAALPLARGRPWLAALLFPLFVLAPNALASARNGMGADRYYYLPIAGVGLAVALGAEALWRRRPEGAAPRALALAWAIPLALAFTTATRATDWGSNEALFSASLVRDPTNPFAAFGYGDVLRAAGRYEEAIPYYRIAMEHDARAVACLQECLGRLGRLEEVVALAPRSGAAPARANVVFALLGLGRLDEARIAIDAAVATFPEDPVLLGLRVDVDAAIAQAEAGGVP